MTRSTRSSNKPRAASSGQRVSRSGMTQTAAIEQQTKQVATKRTADAGYSGAMPPVKLTAGTSSASSGVFAVFAQNVMTVWSRIYPVISTPLSYASLVARIVLGGIFLFAGVAKAMEIQGFAAEIGAYQMLPKALWLPMATIMPFVEIIAGVYLIIGLKLKWASAITGGMIVMFIVGIIWAMVHHLNIDCGCFGNVSIAGLGALKETVSVGKVLQDVGLLALAVLVFFVPSPYTFERWLKRQTREI